MTTPRLAAARIVGAGADAGSIVLNPVLAILLLWMLWPADARGGISPATAPDGGVRLDEVRRGSLLFRSERPDIFELAPTLNTEVSMRISGMIARVRVKQRFHNPGQEWREGIYVFPLPDKAAVDRLRLHVGGRVIEGQIKERGAARKTYDKAKAEGRKAGLVEQERPNIFTTSVANIGPDEEVVVEITYQQTARYDAGSFHLRFPMVVGPRYIPGEQQVAGFGGVGWAVNTDAVRDAQRITPPVRLPSEGLANPVSFDIRLDAGMPLSRVDSPYHAISLRQAGEGSFDINLDRDSVPADRDFELVWTPDTGAAPRAALFAEAVRDEHYVMVMVMPATGQAATAPPPREVIFVIDTSGSMHGPSIEQAKAALKLALARLRPEDRFNVIQFNSGTSMLFNAPAPGDADHLRRARDYVDGLRANGGTEILSALAAALDGRDHPGWLRQVVFLTDGSVGNEAQVFRHITEELGDARLFTIGIGSAPNGHLMTRAAKFGRGTYTYIGDVNEVETRMSTLFQKLERAALTDLEVSWPDGAEIEMWPARLPDLYQGEPVVFTARLPEDAAAGLGEIVISGRVGARPWRAKLPLDLGADRTRRSNPGVGALWARGKIAALMESILDGADREAVRASVIEVALAHRLVSRYTSLVAVDVTPTRPDGAALATGAIATNLPHGWSYEKVFGPLPRTATPAALHLALGGAALLLGIALWWRRRRRLVL